MKELQEFLNQLVKDNLITTDLAQSVITQAQDQDPYSLLQALEILTDEDLLTRQNVLSIGEYAHPGPHELAYALVELHENALLVPTLRDHLKTNNDPLSLANAFVDAKQINLLTDDIIDALSSHEDPGNLIGCFKDLNSHEILNPHIARIVAHHEEPQVFAELLEVLSQQVSLTPAIVEALATIKNPKYVMDIFSQFSENSLTEDVILRWGNHPNENALWVAFGNLSQLSPLNRDVIDSVLNSLKPIPISQIIRKLNRIDCLSSENLSIIANHERPDKLLEALSQMQTQSLFEQELFRGNITKVLKHPYPDDMIWAYKELQRRGLLAGEMGKANFGHLFTYPELTNLNLWHLLTTVFHDELSQEHFDSLVACGQQPLPAGTESYEQAMIRVLCHYPAFFAYIEAHDHEFGEQSVYPFTQEKLASFHEQKEAFEQHNAGVFDISASEAKLGFYLIRNLIRRNTPDLLDEIRFLLSIPAIQSLAHTASNPNEGNELLRLAMNERNSAAAAILMTIEAVRNLAEENDFYQDEAQGGVDLQTLAQDHESSMRGLSIGEEKRLSGALTHYQPLVASKGGTEMVFQALYQTLQDRYRQSPAHIISGSGEPITLPLIWDGFKALPLTAEEHERALQAYYQHTDHTAFRYLSKPNQWMDDNAAYVELDTDNPHLRWSTFSDYKELLAILWLAANDEDFALTNGHSIASRVNHLITELALLGRSHNWDESRPRADNPDEMEEFDDLQADKPSCYSGVKRRLFQSIIGHPLFEFLTLDKIKEELRDFVREHFNSVITDENRGEIQGALQNYYIDLEVSETLLTLNIPETKQQDFFAELSNKYGTQFDEDLSFKAYLINRFMLPRDNQGKLNDAHALNFAAESGLEKLLERPAATALATFGVFQPQQATSSDDEIAENEESLSRVKRHTDG